MSIAAAQIAAALSKHCPIYCPNATYIYLSLLPYHRSLSSTRITLHSSYWLRGDMIEVFQMTHNIYDPDVSLKLEYNLGCSTRGNKYKLLNNAHFATNRCGHWGVNTCVRTCSLSWGNWWWLRCVGAIGRSWFEATSFLRGGTRTDSNGHKTTNWHQYRAPDMPIYRLI